MKKVKFYVSQDESDVYEYPDNVSEEELETDAFFWMDNNVSAYYEIIDEDDEV